MIPGSRSVRIGNRVVALTEAEIRDLIRGVRKLSRLTAKQKREAKKWSAYSKTVSS